MTVRSTVCGAICAAAISVASAMVMAAPPPPESAHESHGGPSPVFMTEKLTAPIGISYEFASEPALGEPLLIRFSITAAGDIPAAELRLDAGDGLQLLDPGAVSALGRLGPGAAAELAVTVLPVASNGSTLRVSVTADSNRMRLFRSVRVPVRLPAEGRARSPSPAVNKTTAGAVVQSAETPATDGPEEAVRSFRARETIR